MSTEQVSMDGILWFGKSIKDELETYPLKRRAKETQARWFQLTTAEREKFEQEAKKGNLAEADVQEEYEERREKHKRRAIHDPEDARSGGTGKAGKEKKNKKVKKEETPEEKEHKAQLKLQRAAAPPKPLPAPRQPATVDLAALNLPMHPLSGTGKKGRPSKAATIAAAAAEAARAAAAVNGKRRVSTSRFSENYVLLQSSNSQSMEEYEYPDQEEDSIAE